MSSQDETRETDEGIPLPTVEELLSEEESTSIEFENEWGDPLESEHTELEEVPERAVIDFGDGVTRDCSMAFIIKRAMMDPDATVLPDGNA